MNGHIYPQIDRHPELIGTYAQPMLLLQNRGPAAAPMFVEVHGSAGPVFQPPFFSNRGLAVAAGGSPKRGAEGLEGMGFGGR
jgi:hypothetical protein